MYDEPKRGSRVCSRHFIDGRPTETHPDPEIELGHNKYTPTKSRPKRKRCETMTGPAESAQTENVNNHRTSGEGQSSSNPSRSLAVVLRFIVYVLLLINRKLRSKLHEFELIVNDHKNVIKGLKAKNAVLVAKIKQLQTENRSKSVFDDMVTSDADVKFFTGIPGVALFNKLHAICEPYVVRKWCGKKKMSMHASTRSKKSSKTFQKRKKLSSKDEFFLVFLRLRLGLLSYHLAKMFKISRSHVSQIFSSWLTCIDKIFANLLFWPSKDHVHATTPARFRAIPNLRAIIDCSEIFIETPKDPKLQAATWSDYKHHNTMKYLIAVAPNSMITYVSPLYTGRSSDKEITLHCGFLDKLDMYDVLQADKGFNILPDCESRLITLHVPPGKRGQAQMSSACVTKTKRNANLRILVEQVIRRQKSFHAMKHEMSVSQINMGDKILRVISAVCNLYGPIYKK